MTELDHKTFDLAAVLAGATFPEDEVSVYFDEAAGYKIYKAEEALRTAEIQGNEEALREVDRELQNLKKKASEVAYRITVRGVPESTRRACDAKAREKHPVEYSFMGQPEPNPDRDEYYNAQLWASSIVKVTAPDGSVALPSEEDILALRNSVGRSVVSTISRAITNLVEGTKKGFETAAQEVDFLSDASPEG